MAGAIPVADDDALRTEDASFGSPPGRVAQLDSIIIFAEFMARVRYDKREHRVGDGAIDALLRVHYSIYYDLHLHLFAESTFAGTVDMPIAWGLFAALTIAFAATTHAIVAHAQPGTRVVADLSAARRAGGIAATAAMPACGALEETVCVYSSSAAAAEAISLEMQHCGHDFLEALDALRVLGRNTTRADMASAHCISNVPPAMAAAWQALKETTTECLEDAAFLHMEYPPPAMEALCFGANLATLLRIANSATDAAYTAIAKAPAGSSTGASAHTLFAMQQRVYGRQCNALAEDPTP